MSAVIACFENHASLQNNFFYKIFSEFKNSINISTPIQGSENGLCESGQRKGHVLELQHRINSTMPRIPWSIMELSSSGTY